MGTGCAYAMPATRGCAKAERAPLTVDTKTELFTGANAAAANADLVAKRTGRKGFEIPTTF